MSYKLDKHIWTDADFEQMGWHDSFIHKIRLYKDLELDIDYILKWNQPEVEGMSFTFWVAPATLVFKSVDNLAFDLECDTHDTFEILDIERITKQGSETTWSILTRTGKIEFNCTGYEQYIRQEPFYQFGQSLSYGERGGYCLERITDQENKNRIREDYVLQREKDMEHYENAKKRQLKRKELASLSLARENNLIDLKTFLLKKREINELLFHYDYFLKGTIFEN